MGRISAAAGPSVSGQTEDTNLTSEFVRADGVLAKPSGVALDTAAGSFQPTGTAAAGANGLGADSGHVHPYQPWQFTPEKYGAKGDVQFVSDAAITSGQKTLTSATAGFTSADVGKTVYIVGAGAAGADLVTTIASFTNATTVTLAASAGATVSSKGMVRATDDTSAVQSAVNAAFTYAQSNGLRAQVVLSKLYGIAAAATVGGATLGNAQITLPVNDPTVNPKVRLEIVGQATDAAEMAHWLQPVLQMSAPGLVCLRLDGTNDATNGPAAVLGGPFHGYGGGTSVFSNVQVVLSNFAVHAPFNSSFSGVDLFGMAEGCVRGSFAARPMAVVPSGKPWPQIANGSITNQFTWGLRLPDVNNNDRCDVDDYSCEGWCYGIGPSEHTTVKSSRTVNCIIGIQGYSTSSTPHGAHIHYASSEACGQASGALSTGAGVKMQIDQLDYEGPTTNVLYDPSNNYSGELRFRNAGTTFGSLQSGGTAARLINLDQPSGPIASPQAVPASTVALTNYYYRDAAVTVSGGTVTVIKVGGQATGITSGTVIVPSGVTIAITYSVAPSWNWVLI